MANQKLSQLTQVSSASLDDLLYIVDDPAGAVNSNSITFQNLQASLTAVGKVGVTQPATGATLVIADGKILNFNNSIIFAGTDGTTMTFPGATDTVVGVAATQTLTNKTLTTPTIAAILNGGTLTLPTGTDTLVARTTTDTLTNKDLTSTTNSFTPASSTQAGVSEFAIASEVNTGTDTTRGITPDALAGSNFGIRTAQIVVSSPTGSAIATGDGQAYMSIPVEFNGMNLVSVGASLGTASSSGAVTIQIRRLRSGSPVDMLSTAITIDQSETDSATAATPPVINTSNDDVATADQIYVDIDGAGSGAKGLNVRLGYQLP